MAGLFALPWIGGYNISKHGMEAMADNYRVELKPSQVHVTIIEPGTFRTEILKSAHSRTVVEERDRGIHSQIFKKTVSDVTEYNKQTPDPLWLEDQMEKVLFARFPPARIAFGPEMFFLPLIHFLPDSVTIWIVRFF